MRKQACEILGVPECASEEEIKTAYKSLVKKYHPDTGNDSNPERYRYVVWAYQYLKANPVKSTMGYGKVIGGSASSARSSFSYARAKEYARFEKEYQKKKDEKRAAFEERVQEEKEKQERYDRAMEAINAIRIAEALKAIINQNK